ncbi:MAG: AAA family ATPase [Campylobacteraceae bacterium]
MELVYLWVEEYKNIKKEGFNFPSEFTYKFNIDTKKLTINKNSNYIKNFFGNNINITAIVGKNGAGKSSIFKLILLLFFLKKFQNIYCSNPEDSHRINAIINILQNKDLNDKQIFLIIKIGTEYKKISLRHMIKEFKNSEEANIRKISTEYISQTDCCLKNSQYKEVEPREINFFTIHYNYMIDTFYDDYRDSWVNCIYHRVDGYDTPLLLEPYKGHEDENNYIDISNIEYLNNGKIFNFFGELHSNERISSFFNPNYIWMMIDSKKILSKYQSSDNLLIDDSAVKIFKDYIKKKIKNKDLIFLNLIYLVAKINSANQDIFINTNFVSKINTKLINIKSEEEFDLFLKEIDTDLNELGDDIISKILIKKNLPETYKIEVCLTFHETFSCEDNNIGQYKEFVGVDSKNKKYNEIKKVFNTFKEVPSWVHVEFYENNKSYSSMSSGEKAFLNFSLNLMYQIKNIKKSKKDVYKTINLLIDEVEIGMHPEWQKKFIDELLSILKTFKLKFNICYATHSPFILSDIPKENVIFLKKDEKGKCINFSKDIDISNTFGANIHTLLSHGFFMEDGLMGEYAKKKIEETYKFLINQKIKNYNKTNNTSKKETINTKEKAQEVINMIGEPIIQKQLQVVFNDKYSKKSKDEIIKELEKENNRLKKENVNLKKKQ